MAISDTFPYREQELFLPKPIIYLGNHKREGDPGLRKKLKSLEYIPLSLFEDYLRELKGGGLDLEKLEQEFGSLTVVTKAAVTGQE